MKISLKLCAMAEISAFLLDFTVCRKYILQKVATISGKENINEKELTANEKTGRKEDAAVL